MADDQLAAMASPPKILLPPLRGAGGQERRPPAEPQTTEREPEHPSEPEQPQAAATVVDDAQTPANEQQQPEPAPAERPRTTRKPRRRTSSRATAKPVGGRPATGRASHGIGLPVPLVQPMKDAAAAARQTYGDWFLAALARQWTRLDDVYPPLPEVPKELPAPRRTPRQQVDGGRQPVNFRFTDEQIVAIDARREKLAVESRSEFVTTVIELDLDLYKPDGPADGLTRPRETRS